MAPDHPRRQWRAPLCRRARPHRTGAVAPSQRHGRAARPGDDALVLVTTNEHLTRLHPAVSRPGRCWLDVEFELLSVDDANAWLEEAGAEVRVSSARARGSLCARRRTDARCT